MTKGQVLLVEDDKALAETYAQVIASRGFEVKIATDGSEAIEIFQGLKNAVIVTDLLMPNLNGLELLKKIKEKHPATQIIIITGKKVEKEDYYAALRFHAFDYLEKPINNDIIVDSIKRAFEESEKVKREIKAKMETQREMLSYLSHTLRSSIGGAHNTIERILEKAKSLLRDTQKEEDAKSVLNNIAKLDAIFMSMSSTLDVYGLLVHTPERLVEGWKNDEEVLDGVSYDYLIALVVKRIISRLLYERPYLSQVKRLASSSDMNLNELRIDYMEDVILEDFSDKNYSHVFEWLQKKLPVIKFDLSPITLTFNQSGMRFNVLFSCIYEVVFNALKYTNNLSPVEINLKKENSDYKFTCRNTFDEMSIARSGTRKGLSFIDGLVKNINAIDFSYFCEKGVYSVQLCLKEDELTIS